RALDDVLQFTDIARLVMPHHDLKRVGMNVVHALLELTREALDEEVRQRRDVVLAIAQGRHFDRDDIDALCRRDGISGAEAVRRAVSAMLADRATREAAGAFGLWRGRAAEVLAT